MTPQKRKMGRRHDEGLKTPTLEAEGFSDGVDLE